MFRFEGHFSDIIFRSLPAIIHIPAHLDQAAVLRWSLERFGAEFHGRSTGHSLMMGHLAPIILLQTLRIYLSSAKSGKNWLVALSHPKLLVVPGVTSGTPATMMTRCPALAKPSRNAMLPAREADREASQFWPGLGPKITAADA
jgi:Cupin